MRDDPPSAPEPGADEGAYHLIRLRRHPWHNWLRLAMWLAILTLLCEFALRSWQEHETQAAVIAGIVLVVLLLGGLLLMTLWRIEDEERSNL